MFEKIKKMFTEKDEKKKNENLVSFLIILVITLIIINKILSKDESSENVVNSADTQLVSSSEVEEVETEDNLTSQLEKILTQISGVGEVTVLLTYSETSPSELEGAIILAEGARRC